MSRAFRDTFKQTFCLCQKIDHHQSSMSFAQIPITRHRKKHSNQTVAYEPVSTYKCPDGDRTSSIPTIKILADNSNKKKKRTSKGLQFFNHTNSISS
jgi:hypothetical protein